MNFTKCIITICVLILCFQKANAQTDTEFWFVAPDITKTIPAILDSPVVLRIATYNQGATVNVSQPAGGGLAPINVTIPANSTHTIQLGTWLSLIENHPPNTVNNKGIYITSSVPITAYYEVVTGAGAYAPRQDNPEIFTLKGKNALGTKFTIPGQTLLENDHYRSSTPYYASIDIVAVEDNTNVTITPAHSIFGHAANTTFTITLNRGQTFAAQATNTNAGQHLNGSLVISDKPIAVTVSDDVVLGNTPYSGGCGDLAGEQIVPDELLGTEYIAINGSLNGPNSYLFITALENNTNVYKDGTLQGTINARQNIDFPIVNNATYITSDKPINVWQLSGIGCEFGATQLPQIECTGSSEVSYVRSTEEIIWINLFVRNGNQGNFTINGNSSVISASDFNPVPATGGQWVFARLQLISSNYPKNSSIKIQNSTSQFHLGILDGGIRTGANYGYFSNYGLSEISANAQPDLCEGDTLNLSSLNLTGASYLWTGPNGFNSNIYNPIIPNVTIANSGWYYLDIDNGICSASDSIYITVHPIPKVSILNSDTTICEGESFVLRATGANTIQWNPPTFLTNPNNPITNCFPSHNIKYFVIGSNAGGCSDSDTITIIVSPPPELEMKTDDSIVGCNKTTTQLHASGAIQYTWSPAELCDNPNSPNPFVTPNVTTAFIVTGINEFGCSSTDTITIQYLPEGFVFIPNAFSPNGDGLNDLFYPQVYCDYVLTLFSIFNRFGELVYTSDQPQPEGWNGLQNNKPADVGIYFWYLEGKDEFGNKMWRKGDVLLIK